MDDCTRYASSKNGKEASMQGKRPEHVPASDIATNSWLRGVQRKLPREGRVRNHVSFSENSKIHATYSTWDETDRKTKFQTSAKATGTSMLLFETILLIL